MLSRLQVVGAGVSRGSWSSRLACRGRGILSPNSIDTHPSDHDSHLVTAHWFFCRLSSCGVTSIPSPALAVAVKSVACISTGVESSSFGPWLKAEAVLLIELFVGCSGVVRRLEFLALSSREPSRVSDASGCVLTRFTFHTLRKTPGLRHRKI